MRESPVKNLLRKANIGFQNAVGELIAFIATLIFFAALFGKAMQPLSPVVTTLLVLGFTIHALSSGKLNAISVLTGLAIYGLAWPVTHQYGALLGMTVWAIGVVLWLVAVTRSFPRAWATVTA